MTFPNTPNSPIGEIVQTEVEQLEGYTKIFLKSNPYPIKQIVDKKPASELTFRHLMGLDALFFILSAIGGALFAAIRTAGVFSGAEYNLLLGYKFDTNVAGTIASVASLCILLGIEGYLLGYGYRRGRESGKLNTSVRGVQIAFSISALAGVMSGFPLLPKDGNWPALNTWITGILVLISGPGISYLVYLCTENVGVLHNKWENMLADLDMLYKEKEKEFERIFQDEVRKWNDDLQADYRTKGRTILFGGEKFVAERKTKGGDVYVQRPVGIQKQVEKWLNERSLTAFDVGIDKAVKPADIAKDLALDTSDDVRTALTRIRQKPQTN